jgi:hypothetical protein
MTSMIRKMLFNMLCLLSQVRGIIVESCRVMESKKKPLWLTLKNADPNGPNIVLMLKVTYVAKRVFSLVNLSSSCSPCVSQVGDDLRQDALILQLLRVMDDLWRREGLEMQMMLYDCISTGFERGLLQVKQKKHFCLQCCCE